MSLLPNSTLNIHLVDNVTICNQIVYNILIHEILLGFDCEGLGDFGRHGKVALIQLSNSTDSYVFDIVKLKNKIPKSLKKLLSNSKPIKCIHDGRRDSDCLFHGYKVTLNGIFDTSCADIIYRYGLSIRISNTFLNKCGKNSMTTLGKILLSENDGKVCVEIVRNLGYKSKRKTVNVFDSKLNIKAKLKKDENLWNKRPILDSLLIYAGMDSYLALKIGEELMLKLGCYNLNGQQYRKIMKLSKIFVNHRKNFKTVKIRNSKKSKQIKN